MRLILAGLGVQGKKRASIAGSELVGTVDPLSNQSDFKSIEDVPLDSYDAAMLCTPDEPKLELIKYLLSNNKHVLVEKPLFAGDSTQLYELKKIAEKNQVACYTAYNHRFEPHFVRIKELINDGSLGKIYSIKLFYGNGTARLVRDSIWRDQGSGVLADLGSHLLNTILFWIGIPENAKFTIHSSHSFENQAPDHVAFGLSTNSELDLQMDVSLLSWRNHFSADIFAEKGSAHIISLCKWGPSKLIYRERKLPSGRPDEKATTLINADPTWALEYEYFKRLCSYGGNNLDNDIWINDVLNDLTKQIIVKAKS